MRPISSFGLEQHAGEYKNWPLRTELLRDGQKTGVKVPGFQILHQFERENGEFVLVTDWDCPFEEATEILLLGPSLRVLCRKTFGAPYYSWLLMGVNVKGADTLELDFGEDGILRQVSIASKTWWNACARLRTAKVPKL